MKFRRETPLNLQLKPMGLLIYLAYTFAISITSVLAVLLTFRYLKYGSFFIVLLIQIPITNLLVFPLLLKKYGYRK